MIVLKDLLPQKPSGIRSPLHSLRLCVIGLKDLPMPQPLPSLKLRDVLSFPMVWERAHPTEKSPLMLQLLLIAFTRKGDLVLDLFSGSGSTLAAAKELGRRYVGIELVKEYAEAARKRLGRK